MKNVSIFTATVLTLFCCIAMSCKKQTPSGDGAKVSALAHALTVLGTNYSQLSDEAKQKLEQDPRFQAKVEQLSKIVAEFRDEPVEIASPGLCHIHVPVWIEGPNHANSQGCQKNLSRGSEVVQTYATVLHEKFPEYDAVLINAATATGNLNPGRYFQNDLNRVIAHSDRLVAMTSTGGELKKAINSLVSRIAQEPSLAGYYPYLAGIRYSLSHKSGQVHVTQLEMKGKGSDDWRKVEDAEPIRILSLHYLATSKGSPYSYLKLDEAGSAKLAQVDPRSVFFQKLAAHAADSGKNAVNFSLSELVK